PLDKRRNEQRTISKLPAPPQSDADAGPPPLAPEPTRTTQASPRGAEHRSRSHSEGERCRADEYNYSRERGSIALPRPRCVQKREGDRQLAPPPKTADPLPGEGDKPAHQGTRTDDASSCARAPHRRLRGPPSRRRLSEAVSAEREACGDLAVSLHAPEEDD